MILRSLINKTSKIRIPNFSISFFSKVVQWYIEHYSTEATMSGRIKLKSASAEQYKQLGKKLKGISIN